MWLQGLRWLALNGASSTSPFHEQTSHFLLWMADLQPYELVHYNPEWRCIPHCQCMHSRLHSISKRLKTQTFTCSATCISGNLTNPDFLEFPKSWLSKTCTSGNLKTRIFRIPRIPVVQEYGFPKTRKIWFSGLLKFQTSGNLDFRKFESPDFRIFDIPHFQKTDARTFETSDLRISTIPYFRKYDFSEIWKVRISGFPKLQVFGNVDLRRPENPHSRISEIPDVRKSGFSEIC